VANEKREGKETYHGIDPTTGKALWEAPVATQKDLDDAVVAAKNAYKTWSKLPLQERTALMEEFALRLDKYKEEFSELLYREIGKPVCRPRAID
jgi:acyl-CoA reductase-like NAD-dependent aldehyde dehydrogenase